MPKVVMLGLDGVPYTLLERYAREGVMPNLAGLLRTGSLRQMDASLPEISSVSWASFMTGVNPGKHNIYGFMDLRPGTYKMYFPNSRDILHETIWDVLGKHGKRSVVLNVPSTYPARPIQGVLAAGFVAIDLRKATYPDSAYEYLKGIGYLLDVDTQKAKESMEAFTAQILEALEKREQAFFHFWETEDWDFFMATVTETDRMHHYLWHAGEDPMHPFHAFFVDFYRRIDALIGKFLARLPEGAAFMMMSDHGFCRAETQAYLNTWLRKQGYLHLAPEDPPSFEAIREGTRAFVMDPARVYLHLKGKYPLGSVAPGREAEALREELVEGVLSLRIDGRPIVRQVFRKEEIYRGPCAEQAPDLVLLPHRGFDLKGAPAKPTLTEVGALTGMHTREDAHFFINRTDLIDKRAHVNDVAPTIYQCLGVPIPESVDGVSMLKA